MLIRNKSVLYTEKDFKKDYGISPSQWAWVTALSGGHNGIPGFPGIGEKKAIEIAKDDKRLIQFVKENPKSLLYYNLSKLPLFEIKNIPEITFPKKQNFLEVELFLRNLNFKVE
jgi:5'-3' exonuclease